MVEESSIGNVCSQGAGRRAEDNDVWIERDQFAGKRRH
jgi:hypothetical protein